MKTYTVSRTMPGKGRQAVLTSIMAMALLVCAPYRLATEPSTRGCLLDGVKESRSFERKFNPRMGTCATAIGSGNAGPFVTMPEEIAPRGAFSRRRDRSGNRPERLSPATVQPRSEA